MSKRSIWFLLIIVILLIMAGLVWRSVHSGTAQATPTASLASTTLPSNNPSQPPLATATTAIPQEQPITIIPLSGPASESKSEISGMAWYNDTLILLPQYPSRFGAGDGAVFALAKDDILAFLDGTQIGPLSPFEIPVVAPGIEQIDGFEGFEAIAFSGNQVFLTIEAKPDNMIGYLVIGSIDPGLSELRLDSTNLTELPPQAQIDNMTDEALLITPNGVLSFFEANGLKNNPSPIVHTFTLSGESLGTLPMTSLEYRLTDVTPLDDANLFWGINYFYPGDTKLTPDIDPLAAQFGEGQTHAASSAVERLVQFQYSEAGIVLTTTPPIQLQLLAEDEARNWEALAYLDQRGFLLATDKFPTTILAFVSLP